MSSDNMWLYVYSAKSIQNYILRSDKLAEMIGASDLVESLSHDILDDTLFSLGLAKARTVNRAAGAARILFDTREEADMLAKFWPFVVNQKCRGLHIV